MGGYSVALQVEITSRGDIHSLLAKIDQERQSFKGVSCYSLFPSGCQPPDAHGAGCCMKKAMTLELNRMRLTKIKAKKAQRKVTKSITLFLLTLFLLIIAFNMNAGAAEITDGAAVFSANCAACHVGGGNIVRRGKNLKPRALKRYGMDSIQAVARLVENGKNAMPAYKDRLSTQEILGVSAYVLEQAEKGWK